jgi:cholesterol oxidase
MQTVDNAMKMVWKKTAFGGKMKIDNSGQKKVPAYIPVGQEVMERYAKKVNGVAQNILLEVFFNRPTTAHILGGCPMSESGEKGVVDKDLKVHGYPNLYITDGSVIQGNIGVNPALTITALSEYAMSRIPSKEGTIPTDISKQLILLEDKWIKKKSD